MKRLLMSSMALVGALLLASTALAQGGGDAAKELATARQHAQLAEASQSVVVAQMHLHHVINCLVGPHGRGFDASAGNPCKGMGDGAAKDAQMDHMKLGEVTHALAYARRGVATKDLSEVHKAAAGVMHSISGG